jgi:MraZ protein
LIDSLVEYWFQRLGCFFKYYKRSGFFSSAVNIVEIWDKDLYEQSINGEDIDFAELAV